MPRSLLVLLAAAVVALAVPPAAHAGWFPPDVIDGPGAVTAFGDIEVARDGTGAVVYLKQDAGASHVFLSRLVDGAWQAPARVDPGLPAASDASVGVSAGGRLAVVWAAGGAVYGAFVPGGASQGLSSPQQVFSDAGRPVGAVDADMGINGTAYAIFAAAGDVVAVRLEDDRWELVPSVLDVAPAQTAGEGAGRPRVAVGAEGHGIAVWGEAHPDGRNRVYERRIPGLRVSAVTQEASIASLDGQLGGAADSPDIAVEEDGSFAWVVFRQDVGGVSRAIARRLVASQLEAPVAIDAGSPAITPRVAIDGGGDGFGVVGRADTTVWAAQIERNAFRTPLRLDTTLSVADPVVATSDRDSTVVAWRTAAGELWGREREEDAPFGDATLLSAPQYGVLVAGAGYGVSADSQGDAAVGFVQGEPGARRLLVTSWDRGPGVPVGRTTRRFIGNPQPTLRWAGGVSLWGALSYGVVVDGIEMGSTPLRKFRPPAPLADGVHQWFVRTVDRRGQLTVGAPRSLRIDTTDPLLEVLRTGQRRKGRMLRFEVETADGAGSGVRSIRIAFGDGTKRVTRRGAALRIGHVYAERGRYDVVVRAVDGAGNATVETLRLRIRK